MSQRTEAIRIPRDVTVARNKKMLCWQSCVVGGSTWGNSEIFLYQSLFFIFKWGG